MAVKRKRLIAAMRESAGEAELLLRAYDRVLDDIDTNHVRISLQSRRNNIASDLRRLRDEVAMLESREPRR